jgi:hypothetical protein
MMGRVVRSFGVALAGLVALLLTGPGTALAQTNIGWGDAAVSLRSNNGQRYDFICPAAPKTLLTVWGTDTYTDNSPICVAALHAGAINRGGGRVFIEIGPGMPSYNGSTRNGVTSLGFGSWPGSYQIVAGDAADNRIDWYTAAEGYRGQNGTQLVFSCPALPADLVPLPPIWGTDIYTDDSAICVAALHAGVITSAGGTVTIEILPGQESYKGTTSNGVTSQRYDSWFGSYRITGGG